MTAGPAQVASGTVERRPSRLAAVAAGALVIVAAAVVVGGGGDGGGGDGDLGPVPPSTSTSTSTTAAEPEPLLPGETADLVVAGDGRLARVNLASGATTDLPLADPVGGIVQQPLSIGDAVVVVQRFVAWSIDPLGRRPPLELGPADAVVPADTLSVWLVDLRRDRAVVVGVNGPPAATTGIPLPDGTWRALPLDHGFVLTDQSRWLVLGRDGRIVHEQAGRALAAGGDLVAWLPQPCRAGPCEVRVTTVGQDLPDRTFTLAATPSVSIHEVGLAGFPSGLVLGGDLEGDRRAYEVVRVDLGDPDLSVVTVATGLRSPPLVIAEGDGTLFWTTRTFGGTGTELTAYEIDTGRTRTVELPVRDISTFSAF